VDEQHRQALEKLQQELKAAEPANESVKVKINSLNTEIDNTIAATAGTPEALHGLRQTLEQAIDDFSAQHPRLAEALREVVNTLVNSGV